MPPSTETARLPTSLEAMARLRICPSCDYDGDEFPSWVDDEYGEPDCASCGVKLSAMLGLTAEEASTIEAPMGRT